MDASRRRAESMWHVGSKQYVWEEARKMRQMRQKRQRIVGCAATGGTGRALTAAAACTVAFAGAVAWERRACGRTLVVWWNIRGQASKLEAKQVGGKESKLGSGGGGSGSGF